MSDEKMLAALAMIEAANRTSQPGLTADQIAAAGEELEALVGDDGRGVAMRLAQLVFILLNQQGMPVQAWVDEYRRGELEGSE